MQGSARGTNQARTFRRSGGTGRFTATWHEEEHAHQRRERNNRGNNRGIEQYPGACTGLGWQETPQIAQILLRNVGTLVQHWFNEQQ